MSEASTESILARGSCIDKTTYLNLPRVRRASEYDLSSLLKFVNNQTRQLFGEVNYKKILKTCFIPTCIENDQNEPIGFICLDHYPNVPYIPSSDWCCWLSNIYGLHITTPRNTAWIHLVVYNDEHTSEFLQPIFRSIFEEYSYLEYVVLVIPPHVSSIEFIEGYGTRIVPPGFYDSKKVQTLYLLVRQHFVTKYKIRRAVEEDNDDLVPLVYEYSHQLTETYGEFYVAEILTRHADSGRQLIVAEHNDMAVSVLFLNSWVNDSLLNDEFELVPFHGLRKPHPKDEIHDFYRPSSVADLLENQEDDTFSKLHTKPIPSESVPSYLDSIVTEHEEGSTTSEYPEDDILLVNVSSVHLLIQEHSDFLSITSSESQTFSAMMLSCSNDQDLRLSDDQNVLSKLDLEPNLKNLSGADFAQNFPSFLGELNAFSLEVAASQPEHELESTLLLLAAAFECFPEREYCVMSIPSTCPPFPMLDHFVRVTPRPTSAYPQELYILHRNAIMSELSVRRAVISDIEEVQRLIDNISVIHDLIDVFLSAVCEEYDFVSYVMISEDKIVGVSVVKDETNFDYLKAHYILTETLEEGASYGLLLHLVLSPIFLRHGKYFLREIMRLSDYTVLNYYVAPSDTVTLTRDKPICNALGDMIPIKPRRMAEYTQNNLGECVPDHPVIKLLDPFALYVITGQYCTLKQYDINAKIVVVGSSDTALAFLDSLINGESASYRVNFTNITVVSPHGLNYQKKYHKVRNRMFVSKSNYNYRQMNQIAMRTYVNIINGVMTKIDRRHKLLVVNKDSYVPYDLLLVMGGQQFQKPQVASSKEFPENVFLINTEMDATHALKQLKFWTDPLPDSKYTVIVYGYALEAFCCVGALLEFGVPAANITFIESYPPLSEHIDKNLAMQFADPEVDNAVADVIASEGVVHYKSFYFVKWILDKEINHITSATFESGHRRLFLDCIAMFMYNEKTVSARTSLAITSAGLVFDGGLVIDPNCQTIDPFIYGAGTLTKYSRRYYADHLAHKYFNLEEIGYKLGQRIRRKLIPNYDECPPEELLHCAKENMVVPHYKQALITFCHLPGNLQYLSVTKPGKQVPLAVASADDDYGHVLVTGDCKSIDKQGYFRLHINQYGVVETITCLAKFNLDRQNITSLWGKHEKLLNNVKTRFEMVLITDLFDYFKEPWTCAIYHDRFANFQDSTMNLMHSVTSVKGLSPIEDIIRMFRMNNGQKLNFDQEAEMDQKFVKSSYHKVIQKRLLDFVYRYRMFLPMYAHPHVVSRLETDCEKSPLFWNQ